MERTTSRSDARGMEAAPRQRWVARSDPPADGTEPRGENPGVPLHTGEPLSGRRPAVLVVDDQQGLAEALVQWLALQGIDADVAGTHAEALEAASRRAHDLAIVDVHLPGVSGVVTARELKSLRPEIKVVLVTGLAALVDDPTLRSSGADAILPKPWRPAEMEAVMRGLLTV